MSQLEFAQFFDPQKNREVMLNRFECGKNKALHKKLQLIIEIKAPPFKQSSAAQQSFTFIDLFAGIGGIRLPYQQAGGRCVFSSEWDKYSQTTYAANFGEFPSGDITKIPASAIPDHDILLAGFHRHY